MKLIGLALALAAAGLSPAAAAVVTPPAGTPEAAAPLAGEPASTEAAPEPTTVPAPVTPADPEIGQPQGDKGIQFQVTDVGEYAAEFHNNWLLLLCALISLFVLGLLCWTIVRYRRGANPTPSRTSHNTAIEVIWTLVPVLILVAIAIPSMRLLNKQYTPPPADLTVKVVGNQWFWTYQYPDHGEFEIISNMLKECDDPTLSPGARCRTDADGPPLLAVDERLVIPAGKVVKFMVTSNDVMHAFGIPAFWSKIDANPGRLNETWVKVDKPGVYFGQCYELCGARHAYMPIAVEVLPEAQFAAWVASKGGTMPGAALPATSDEAGGGEADAQPASEEATEVAVPAGVEPVPPQAAVPAN